MYHMETNWKRFYIVILNVIMLAVVVGFSMYIVMTDHGDDQNGEDFQMVPVQTIR